VALPYKRRLGNPERPEAVQHQSAAAGPTSIDPGSMLLTC